MCKSIVHTHATIKRVWETFLYLVGSSEVRTTLPLFHRFCYDRRAT